MTRPAAIPAASSGRDEKACVATGSGQIAGTKVDPSHSTRHPSARISSAQLDSISSRLSDEGHGTLLLLSEVRLATGHQIARRLWAAKHPSDSRARLARQTLARLEQWRVIERISQRIGGVRGGASSIVYSIGPAGRRLLSRLGYESKRLRAPGDRYVKHVLAATELVVRLHEADIGGDLDVISLQTEPRCWRAFLGLMGGRAMLKPDLFVRVGAGALEDRYFIEIDLATESVPTLVSKAQRYVAYYRSGTEQQRHGVFPHVVWTAPNRQRAEKISEAMEQLAPAARKLFLVWDYDEVIGRLAMAAQS